VALGCVVAVPKQLGDHGRWCGHNETLQSGVSRCKQIDTQSFKPIPDRLRAKMVR
jgi:hypothetical protein